MSSESEGAVTRLSRAPILMTDRSSLSSPTPDADPLVTGAPGAPMDVQCYDANRDYVIVTWKPPNTTTEGAVIGYFIDR